MDPNSPYWKKQVVTTWNPRPRKAALAANLTATARTPPSEPVAPKAPKAETQVAPPQFERQYQPPMTYLELARKAWQIAAEKAKVLEAKDLNGKKTETESAPSAEPGSYEGAIDEPATPDFDHDELKTDELPTGYDSTGDLALADCPDDDSTDDDSSRDAFSKFQVSPTELGFQHSSSTVGRASVYFDSDPFDPPFPSAASLPKQLSDVQDFPFKDMSSSVFYSKLPAAGVRDSLCIPCAAESERSGTGSSKDSISRQNDSTPQVKSIPSWTPLLEEVLHQRKKIDVMVSKCSPLVEQGNGIVSGSMSIENRSMCPVAFRVFPGANVENRYVLEPTCGCLAKGIKKEILITAHPEMCQEKITTDLFVVEVIPLPAIYHFPTTIQWFFETKRYAIQDKSTIKSSFLKPFYVPNPSDTAVLDN